MKKLLEKLNLLIPSLLLVAFLTVGMVSCSNPDDEQPAGEFDCNDGVDNDGDAAVDCADYDCYETTDCA